jgi:superfamily II DNA or RNA helicase/ribulose bisphosphate carboxylase small subunit
MMTENLNLGIDIEGLEEPKEIRVIRLRSYQIDSRNAIFNAWERGCRSVMYQSPTGSGKTATIASIVKTYHENGLKTLTLAHRDELVDNIIGEYMNLFGIETGAIKSGLKRNYDIDHQVASIATYVNALDFDPDLIITDEGHHCLAKTYLTIYAAHPRAKLLMVTATPYRLSGLGFTDICDELVLSLSVAQLEKMGNLIPARLWAMTTFTHDQIAQVHVVKGEYSETEMSNLLSETRQIMSVVDTYIERGEGKQMMLYATSVDHSKKLVEAFEWRGIRAGHVDGKTKDRKRIFEQFVNKEIQVLSNCEIATEGNNIPCIEIVGLARKTKSLSMYLQMVGRASRPWENQKAYLLFDFVDNYWEHGLPNREHDWKSHFLGVTRKERQKKEEGLERQFMIESETGEVFISNLAKLPDGFKGQILEEVDPLNTKQAEILRKRQAKLDEINRKKREKEEAIQRKKDEIQRRKDEKAAYIQRIKDEKLAEIQRKKEAKEAAIQRKIAEREAKIQRKLDEKAAKLQRIEDARLAKIREEEERQRSYRRSHLINSIQWETRPKREAASKERYQQDREKTDNRYKAYFEFIDSRRGQNYSWDSYYELQEKQRQEAKADKLESKLFAQFQRMEIQFEIGIRMSHQMRYALNRVIDFCYSKSYTLPTLEQLIQITEIYWTTEGLFTKEQFYDAVAEVEKRYRIQLLPVEIAAEVTEKQ